MRTVAALLVLLGAASAQKTAGDYHLSKNGKCPKGWSFMDKASVNECTAASRALKLPDKTASWTSSTTIPLGCAACASPHGLLTSQLPRVLCWLSPLSRPPGCMRATNTHTLAQITRAERYTTP